MAGMSSQNSFSCVAFRLVAGKVHGIGADGEFADVVGQGESAVGVHLGGQRQGQAQHQAQEGGFERG